MITGKLCHLNERVDEIQGRPKHHDKNHSSRLQHFWNVSPAAKTTL